MAITNQKSTKPNVHFFSSKVSDTWASLRFWRMFLSKGTALLLSGYVAMRLLLIIKAISPLIATILYLSSLASFIYYQSAKLAKRNSKRCNNARKVELVGNLNEIQLYHESCVVRITPYKVFLSALFYVGMVLVGCWLAGSFPLLVLILGVLDARDDYFEAKFLKERAIDAKALLIKNKICRIKNTATLKNHKQDCYESQIKEAEAALFKIQKILPSLRVYCAGSSLEKLEYLQKFAARLIAFSEALKSFDAIPGDTNDDFFDELNDFDEAKDLWCEDSVCFRKECNQFIEDVCRSKTAKPKKPDEKQGRRGTDAVDASEVGSLVALDNNNPSITPAKDKAAAHAKAKAELMKRIGPAVPTDRHSMYINLR